MSDATTAQVRAADEARTAIGDTIRRVLLEEAAAITAFSETCPGCIEAVELILRSDGPLVVAGIGKSGHVARKLAATFRSLGRFTVYLHPGEASHGDLGLVQPGSVALVFSNSGETSELSDLLHFCRSHDVPVIGVTGRAKSALARASTVAICYGELEEACHVGLAPTTTTTLSLAIGDALAVSLSQAMGVAPEDFRRYHPGGRLGARLLTVGELMRTGDAIPLVDAEAGMADVVLAISEKSMGVAVLTRGGAPIGVITDGDLRRNIDRLWDVSPTEIASPDPERIRMDMLVSDAADEMSRRGVTSLLVDDAAGALCGIIHLHDCVRSGATG